MLPPEPREMTIKAVSLGVFLALIFGAANAYLGMRAGQTVAATLPAAVIAMALFRIPAFRGTLLEQNITRTAASVGEALVAGAIFTIPAFAMVGYWKDLRTHYWEATAILLCGGLIGVFFIIILRRPLCVEADLPWPESVAAANIVKSGGEASDAPKYIFSAMAFGGLIQFLKTDKGLQVFREYIEGFIPFGRSGGIPWSTPALSPALVGIGYIIGPKYAFINIAGGILAWWVLIPLILTVQGPTATPPAANDIWRNTVRPIAVGMMLVGAFNTMFGMRSSLFASLRGAFTFGSGQWMREVERTERDIPLPWILIALLVLLIPITATYYLFTGSLGTALVSAIAMMFIGFFLCAVGGYLVGLVGSSNQPLSGLTLSALIIAALLLVSIGVKGPSGVAAVLGVAAVVATACSVSGSLIQDFKAGQLLGGTPWKMQIVEILAVVILAFFLMGPIIVLHEANLDTGGIGGRALPAPQAGLMAQLSKGIVSGDMPWGLLVIGIGFGLALMFAGARAPMLIAVGMYLPFDTSAAIALGGLIKLVVDRRAGSATEEARQRVEDRGSFLASGLIAGEAVMGIILAVTFLSGIPSFTRLLIGADEFSFFAAAGTSLSMLGYAALAWVLIYIPLSATKTK
ncbi:MAG: oligopeptide transporter, OPT family [Bryobacteraceae bacterium]|nr:oligopeptide transporter, OPT family [Bryobacteraceae bacterium]